MYSGTQEGNSLNLNLTHDHNVARINDAIGFLPKAWSAAKKYSVNNTLSIAAVNTWLQFSLAYVTAMIITLNDLSFIATFNPTLMPTYFLVSVILGVVLLTSLALRYIYKQEIKNEKSKDGDSPIDIKIRGGKSNEINEIAQNALTIEIVPDLVDKKQGFSIVLPISKRQGEILENKRQENRNKVILLTVPYVLSGLIVVGALIQNKFSFANVHGWEEWTFIAFVSAVFIAGICIALSKSNEVNNACNIVKKFDNLDILLPCRKGIVVSVMENKFESKEENDPISRLIKLLDKRLTHLVNEVCYLFDNSLLKPANIKIEKTLDGIRKDIETLLNNLKESIQQNVDGVEATANEAIIQYLEDIDKSVDELCKGVGKDVQKKLDKISIKDLVNNLSRLAETLEDRISRLKPGARMGLSGATFVDERLPNAPGGRENDQLPQDEQTSSDEVPNAPGGRENDQLPQDEQTSSDEVPNAPGGRENDQLPQDEQTSSDEVPNAQRVYWKKGVKEIGQLKKKIKALERVLKKKENNQNQPGSGNSSSSSESVDSITNLLEKQRNVLRKENKDLKLQQEIKDLQEENAKLKKKSPEQEEINKWQKSINGNPSEFLHYILESIKLEEKGGKGEKIGEATLWNFDNKIIIHWKDGSQTTCHIKKQGDLPSTKVDFVNQNIQAAWEMARGKSL
ncbi:hypothetical protein [Wolbachia endosymbiont (group A) of Sicus ferrugineus]|uniref:hypothetical protein n=1 Tax=Wolbachia endosymbiont (group A) of Sicus ferrugineus TaxID=2954056 RepID=UPI00222F4D83|nr:hypothetical protein [Wolbachia endosymbiont (group A) of Sicus ferrugineus]